MKKIFRRFKEWELRPYQVAPLSEEEHNCATCGTHYQGNYCPRCGQSAKIGRYSFICSAISNCCRNARSLVTRQTQN